MFTTVCMYIICFQVEIKQMGILSKDILTPYQYSRVPRQKKKVHDMEDLKGSHTAYDNLSIYFTEKEQMLQLTIALY